METIGNVLYNHTRDCEIIYECDDSIIYKSFLYPVLKERIPIYKGAFYIKKSECEVSFEIFDFKNVHILLDNKEKFKIYIGESELYKNSICSVNIEVTDEYGDEISALIEVEPTEYSSIYCEVKEEKIKEIFEFIKEELLKYKNLDNILLNKI